MTDETTPGRRWSFADAMIAYDEGTLDEAGTIVLFQYLVDTGLAWTFPGRIGRQAADMIDAGLVTVPPQAGWRPGHDHT